MAIKSVIPILLASPGEFQRLRREALGAADLPPLTVYKSPTCGCCVKWVEHMRKAGFEVDGERRRQRAPGQDARRRTTGQRAPATPSEVAGYFLEGHVPASDVKRLLAERPAAKGLAVPGMPMGSPGMEVPDGRTQAYDVELVANDGTTSRFSRHGGVMTHSGIT